MRLLFDPFGVVGFVLAICYKPSISWGFNEAC